MTRNFVTRKAVASVWRRVTSFTGDVPSGVERVEYEVNLTGFEHLRVAAKPAEFVFE
jgi:hypothetical protein